MPKRRRPKMDVSTLVGLWCGFLLSLMTFSLVFKDNILTRLAQYILVGAATGYLIILLIQDILRPRLITPIFAAERAAFDLILPLLLGTAIILLGLHYTIRQGRESSREQPTGSATERGEPLYGKVIKYSGIIALWLLFSIGFANSIVGMLQGTLFPQFWQATRLQAAGAPWSAYAGGFVALLITVGVILHLHVVTPTANVQQAASLSVLGRIGVLTLWAGLGKRALWFAAGVLFARLAASRLSLLTVWLESIIQFIERLGFIR